MVDSFTEFFVFRDKRRENGCSESVERNWCFPRLLASGTWAKNHKSSDSVHFFLAIMSLASSFSSWSFQRHLWPLLFCSICVSGERANSSKCHFTSNVTYVSSSQDFPLDPWIPSGIQSDGEHILWVWQYADITSQYILYPKSLGISKIISILYLRIGKFSLAVWKLTKKQFL